MKRPRRPEDIACERESSRRRRNWRVWGRRRSASSERKITPVVVSRVRKVFRRVACEAGELCRAGSSLPKAIVTNRYQRLDSHLSAKPK